MPATQRQNTGRSASFADTPFRSIGSGVNPILPSDLYLLLDATLGNITLPLPDATTIPAGKGFWLLRTDAVTTNTATLTTVGGQTINGASSVLINPQYQSIYVVSTGANWVLYASPNAFTLSPDILWVFPGQLATDQAPNIFIYKVRKITNLIAFDANLVSGPIGTPIFVDWSVNNVVVPAYRVTVNIGATYGETVIAATLNPNDLLTPVLTQIGSSTPGSTIVMRARGS